MRVILGLLEALNIPSGSAALATCCGSAPIGSSALLASVNGTSCQHGVMRRNRPAFILLCNVYLHIASDQAVIAECFNHGELQAEVAGAARLIDASDQAEIGRETLAALDACRWEPSFNYRNHKKSDWPAYKASGEPSVKRFEQRWRRIRVAGANDSNITWELSVLLNQDHQLTMTAVVAQRNDPARLGNAIRFLNAQAGRFAEHS